MAFTYKQPKNIGSVKPPAHIFQKYTVKKSNTNTIITVAKAPQANSLFNKGR